MIEHGLRLHFCDGPLSGAPDMDFYDEPEVTIGSHHRCDVRLDIPGIPPFYVRFFRGQHRGWEFEEMTGTQLLRFEDDIVSGRQSVTFGGFLQVGPQTIQLQGLRPRARKPSRMPEESQPPPVFESMLRGNVSAHRSPPSFPKGSAKHPADVSLEGGVPRGWQGGTRVSRGLDAEGSSENGTAWRNRPAEPWGKSPPKPSQGLSLLSAPLDELPLPESVEALTLAEVNYWYIHAFRLLYSYSQQGEETSTLAMPPPQEAPDERAKLVLQVEHLTDERDRALDRVTELQHRLQSLESAPTPKAVVEAKEDDSTTELPRHRKQLEQISEEIERQVSKLWHLLDNKEGVDDSALSALDELRICQLSLVRQVAQLDS